MNPQKSPEAPTVPTANETLFGGKPYIARKLDGSTEEVTIRQLPVKDFLKLTNCLNDEPGQVELFCAKPAGWSDTLTLESFEAIVIEGERINRDFFTRWAKRALNRQNLFAPEIAAMLPSDPSASPNTSPK